MAAASKPLSNGSSEKYSKLRPHKGLRLIASQRFIAARDDYGLTGFRFHDLRHQHVSILLRNLALPEVAARAGHANPAVTSRIYAHLLKDGHQQGADAVALMLAKTLRTASSGGAGTNGVHFCSAIETAVSKALI